MIHKILVIGDVMLDRYFWGEAERLSPEAPVPVVGVTDETLALGGAANVAANVVSLGCGCVLIGAVGKDQEAFDLTQLARDFGIDEYLVGEKDRPTTTKTRVVAGTQHVVRLDRESTSHLYAKGRASVYNKILKHIDCVQAVVISDYAKGVCEPGLVREVLGKARELGIPTFVDPKGSAWDKYEGAFCITPNYREFCTYALVRNYGFASRQSLGEAAQHKARQLHADYIIVTHGDDGMIVAPAKGTWYHSPANKVSVTDVSGAGDTVIAALATMRASSPNADMNRVADYANAAAAVAVSKLGTTPVWRIEVPSVTFGEDYDSEEDMD